MIENNEIENDEIDLDLSEIIHILKKKFRVIISFSIICGLIALATTVFFIDKKYSSETMIYITPRVTESGTVILSEIQTNSKLVNNYMEILKGDVVLDEVAKKVNLKSASQVRKGLSVTNKDNTEIIKIKATTTDPNLSKNIVASTVEVFSSQIKEILNVENITMLNEPKVNTRPVSPNIFKNTFIGLVIGGIIPIGFFFVAHLLDQRLRSRQAAEEYLGIPVLACVPVFGDDE